VEKRDAISARVLRYSSTEAGSSIISTELPGSMVHGDLEVSMNMALTELSEIDCLLGLDLSLSTDESCRCLEETNRKIIPHAEWNYILGPRFLSNNERMVESQQLAGWELPVFDDSAWESPSLLISRPNL
jgi:hypothetical protein